jgi:hypothetical protein
MKSKRSRLALVGVLALAISVTVGLVSGNVADAKKKKKGAKSFTISKTTPTAIPARSTASSPLTFVKVPIGTVGGKKLKNKIIGFSTVSVTTTFNGDPGFADSIQATVISPVGRTSSLTNPTRNSNTPAPSETVSGPTTETPNSSTLVCIPQTTAPAQPPCADPDATLGPPYAGTIGNTSLAAFEGTKPQGTWFVKLRNTSTTTNATLSSITVNGELINALPTS